MLLLSFAKLVSSSVWAPACQDVIIGGHASVCMEPRWLLRHVLLPSVSESFRLGRAIRVVPLLRNGEVLPTLLWFMGTYHGAEMTPKNLL